MAFRSKTYTDETLIKALSDATLPPLDFTHKNHIRLVWAIHRRSPQDTFKQASYLIRNYAFNIGESHIYHETLTYAAVKIIVNCMNTSSAQSFEEFIESNNTLLVDFKSLISKHYSQETLDSKIAKTKVVLPDLAPF